MCGICGIIGNESSPASEAIVRRMMAAIVHRGPDEEGILIASPVVAGTRRLSIIDLPGGSQPVWNETGTIANVFNGEIYNFRELRAELESKGHKFRTRSDTEVIVHAYEAWGEDCVRRLEGMFAFAVVEMPQGRAGRATRVFLARDRLGIKPLYYTIANGALLFASEVRALLASGRVAARLSAVTIPSYLLFGSVSEPCTLIDGVVSLPPGHSMTVNAAAPVEKPEPKSYWGMTADSRGMKTSSRPRDPSASPAGQVRTLLEDGVRSHLVADVPVGVFLSSGIDSTAIAALACRVQGGIHTFTVAFPDIEFSEAKQSRQTAERLGTEHVECTLSDQEMLARLDEAIAGFDQPSMDGINTYFVSWAARQSGLKVALSGLGSDELFGGYTSFRATRQVIRAAKLARLVPKTLRSLVASAGNHGGPFGLSRDAFRKGLAAWLDPKSFPHAYFFTRALFTPQSVARTQKEAADGWDSTSWWRWISDAAREASSMDDFTAVSWLELRSYLVNTLLRDTDAMSMRNSLEIRVPFLDSSLVEYVLSLPESVKLNRSRPKALLVEALGSLLPEDIASQRKRTFTFPWENWLRGSLAKRVAAGLAEWSPTLESQVSRDFALCVWKDFEQGHTTWSRPWSLYVLNEWVKRNIDAH
jgi:asparagine synthase (glutamine-hydrolysing)